MRNRFRIAYGCLLGVSLSLVWPLLASFGDDVKAARLAPPPILERSAGSLADELGDHVALIDCQQINPDLAGFTGRVYVDPSEPKVVVLCAPS